MHYWSRFVNEKAEYPKNNKIRELKKLNIQKIIKLKN
jgi:hypothetical protein